MISFLQIASLSNSIPEVYSELCQITRMKRFANIVHGIDYFRRTLQHRYLTGFWMCCFILSWRTSLSYRNRCIDLQIKSMDWFLYNRNLPHERVKLQRLRQKWFRNFTTSHSFTFTKRSYTFNTKVYVIL